jgi:hypothetical protein
LYDCFKEDTGTDNESQLHEDVYVKKKLRDHIGAKEFKKMDALDGKLWYEAWKEFEIKVNTNKLI